MENSLDRSVMNVQRQFPLERGGAVLPVGQAWPRQRLPRRPSFRPAGGRLIPGQRTKAELPGERTDASSNELYVDVLNGKDMDSDDGGVDGALLISSQLQVFPGTSKSGSTPDWDRVAQVVCVLEEGVSCPICLYPPIVPRISRCGHIYCGPCAFQYINYENDSATKKCAVCCSLVSLAELKRAILSKVPQLKVGDDLEMVLVGRGKSARGWDVCTSVPAKVAHPDRVYQFIAEATPADIASRDADELETLFLLKSECVRDGTVELVSHINQMIDQLVNKRSFVESRDYATRAFDNDEGPSELVYFYQAVDGRLIFLDGLMWNCLLAEHGTASNLPNPLVVKVTSIRSYKMCQSLRRRWRHLSHLPLGRVFVQIGIELQHLVSETSLAKFSTRLDARKLEQDRRRLEDMRLTRLKEDAENRIQSLPQGFVLSGPAPLSHDPVHFPQPPNSTPICSSSAPVGPQGPSFAEVTKKGALSVVDRNRVATFGRGFVNRPCASAFSPSTEYWPSLNDSACLKNDSPASGPTRFRRSSINFTCDQTLSQESPSFGISSTSVEKQSRKRRSRILTHRDE